MTRLIGALALMIAVGAACTGQTELEQADGADEPTATAEVEGAPDGGSLNPDDEGRPAPDPDAAEVEPVPYIPAGRPGTAAAYAELIERLQAEVPADLRSQVPWPDLRNPNPIVAQVEIFDLWIWMAANHTEPRLVEAMAAPGSPSREVITGVFGRLQSRGVFETRSGADYKAFDHRVVTFESAGLPLWLGRDVPEDAVVVYYRDNSGPVDVVDQQTGNVTERQPAVPTRAWLSIMVPTDVGWQLWKDQLIEPSDPELEIPDVPPPPGPDAEQRTPEV